MPLTRGGALRDVRVRGSKRGSISGHLEDVELVEEGETWVPESSGSNSCTPLDKRLFPAVLCTVYHAAGGLSRGESIVGHSVILREVSTDGFDESGCDRILLFKASFNALRTKEFSHGIFYQVPDGYDLAVEDGRFLERLMYVIAIQDFTQESSCDFHRRKAWVQAEFYRVPKECKIKKFEIWRSAQGFNARRCKRNTGEESHAYEHLSEAHSWPKELVLLQSFNFQIELSNLFFEMKLPARLSVS